MTSNSLISNNASITGGKFETKYGSDSVKVENGRLSAYFDDKKVEYELIIHFNVKYNKKSIILRWSVNHGVTCNWKNGFTNIE